LINSDLGGPMTEVLMTEETPNGTGASLDTLADNRAGRASALTTLTPLPRPWAVPLKLLLKVKSWTGPDKTLRRLSFIHAAYWVVIDRFPGEKQRSKYSYLLFISNFNGSWFDYIDVFSTAVPTKMALLWGSSYGFPGPIPPRSFTRYIRANDRPLEHYYSAYPNATTTEIASALRVSERFQAEVLPLAGRTPADAAEIEPAVLAQAWRRFLVDAQRDL
jgi:hypothetical protein